MVNSRENLKDYFFPVYALWAFVTPTILVFLSGYVFAGPDEAITQAIDWTRVPAIYALFGFIWPLTLVISPIFYIAFREETGYTFFEALSFADADATIMFYASILFFIAWIVPVLHFLVQVIRHKQSINNLVDEKLSWADYLFGFIQEI